MNPIIYRYPLDPTGVNVNNLVVDEEHRLSNRAVRCVALTYGGFFADSVIVKNATTDQMLVKGQDYYFGELFEFPTGRYGKEVFGLIVITKANVTDVRVTAQMLGGDYSYSMQSIIAMIDNLELGERPVEWGAIVGRPATFEPASHLHDIGDVYGFEYVAHSVDRLRQAVLMGDTASHDEIYRYMDQWGNEVQALINTLRQDFAAHRDDRSNPHGVTKAQVGLGSVENYPIATQAEAQEGVVSNKYMTPVLTAQAIAVQAIVPLNAHTSRIDNPHGVTKAQVGLGIVENFTLASQADAEAGSAHNVYMTPIRTAQAVARQALVPLNAHIGRNDNPHGVTKAQIGLGSVENYGLSTHIEAQEGASHVKYMTPLMTAHAIVVRALEPLNNHISNQANPHNVTKGQIGLGSVVDYGVASKAQAEAGVAGDKYMTPLLTAQAIAVQALAPLAGHTANMSNPHNVSKGQIGLGSVQDYGIASQAEGQAGTSNVKYMTPLSTAQAIAVQSVAALNGHTNNMSNPHNTTKAQLGLGSVENYGIASHGEAEAGGANDRYMTPLRVAQAIWAQAVSPLNGHTNNMSNPHNTNKVHVGLGSVENYGISAQSEAEAGTSTVKYMTPQRTAQAIWAQVGAALNGHTSNAANPHNTTKAQVGLGSVENYGIATQAEAEAGSSTVKYMTPQRVAQAIASQSNSQLSAHTSNRSNPHGVSKDQVGLGSVENYPIATQAEAQAGNATTRYMTPQRTAEAIAVQAVAPLNGHIGNRGNPHGVTKAQVGLGNVNNFGIANSVQAVAALQDDLYMTPVRTLESIRAYALTNTNFSSVTQAPLFLSNQGTSNAGYSFRNEGGYDTGMFSMGDGDLRLIANAQNVITTAPESPLVIHRRTDFIAQPMAMVTNEWLTPGTLHLLGTGSGDWGMAGMQFSISGAYGIRMGLRADGFFGIGGASRAAWSWYTDPSGNMVAAGDVVGYSDPRLKEDFELIHDPFRVIEAVQGWSFTWRHGIPHIEAKAGARDYGFNALKVHEVAPELVHSSISIDGEKYLTVAYDKFIPFHSRALVQLKDEIKDVKAELAEMKKIMSDLIQGK